MRIFRAFAQQSFDVFSMLRGNPFDEVGTNPWVWIGQDNVRPSGVSAGAGHQLYRLGSDVVGAELGKLHQRDQQPLAFGDRVDDLEYPSHFEFRYAVRPGPRRTGEAAQESVIHAVVEAGSGTSQPDRPRKRPQRR